MDILNCKTRKVNRSLTNMIIRLHEKGYTEDFSFGYIDGKFVLSHCDVGEIGPAFFKISMINQFFDNLTYKFKYLHAIEANCGMKGMLLTSSVLFTGEHRSGPVEEKADNSRTLKYETPLAYQQAV